MQKLNVKQHPELELLLFEIICFIHPRYHPEIIGQILKNVRKKDICLNEVIWLMTMEIRLKMKRRSHRYDMNRPHLSYI